MVNKFNENFNLFDFILIVMAGFFAFWLMSWKIEAGTLFFQLLMFGIVMYILILLFIKEESQSSFYIPISTSYIKAVTLFIFFFGLPVVLFYFSGVDTAKSMIPLTAGKFGVDISQSFQVLQISLTPVWDFATTVILAGVLEELVFGFAVVGLGILIGLAIRGMFKIDFGTGLLVNNKNFDLMIGLFLSALFFVTMHLHNDTYTSATMFIWAGIFRTLLNIAIWKLGFLLSATIGYHMGNNFVFWMQTNGTEGLLSALTSWQGVIIVSIFSIIILFFILNIKKSASVFSEIFGGWFHGK